MFRFIFRLLGKKIVEVEKRSVGLLKSRTVQDFTEINKGLPKHEIPNARYTDSDCPF